MQTSSYPCQPVLEVEEEVYFGNLVANSKTISKEISLFNHGSKAGEFKLKYSGDKPIAIMPSSGTVPPKSVQLIKVDNEYSVKKLCFGICMFFYSTINTANSEFQIICYPGIV